MPDRVKFEFQIDGGRVRKGEFPEGWTVDQLRSKARCDGHMVILNGQRLDSETKIRSGEKYLLVDAAKANAKLVEWEEMSDSEVLDNFCGLLETIVNREKDEDGTEEEEEEEDICEEGDTGEDEDEGEEYDLDLD